MSQEQKPFRVNDRRHFTADGRSRGEPLSESSAPPAPTGAAGPPPGSQPSPAPQEADFGAFVLSLGAQASLLLSDGGDEEEDPAARLQEARSIISILEMLKDKTEGRRIPQEDRILEHVLYELRMGYLARTGVGGA